MYLGWRDCGLKLKELVAEARGIDYATMSAAIRQVEQWVAQNRQLAPSPSAGEREIIEFEDLALLQPTLSE